MGGITDTHAHYTDERFVTGFPGGAAALLDTLFASGVGRIINVATNTENSREVIKQAAGYPGMYCAVGVHPSDITLQTGGIDAAMTELRDMLDAARENKIVAVGEIGLDYYWQPVDRQAQAEYFEAQLRLAGEYGLPVSIHDRDAHGDVFETLLCYPAVRGVLHSYSGSAEMAHELVRRGWYISFSGVITFRNAARVRAVAGSVPAERLLLETDCPYLAPEPNRGKLNRSDNIRYTAAALAELHGMTGEEMIELTCKNACALFGF